MHKFRSSFIAGLDILHSCN